MRRGWYVGLAAGAVVAVVVATLAWTRGSDGGPDRTVDPEPTQLAVERQRPAVVARPDVLRPDPDYFSCDEPAGRPFTPVSISVQQVTRGSTVLAVPRDGYGVPGVPPVSTAGKSQFAFDDPGIHPGEPQGNVILTAHTWPDGTAMGNRLLAALDEGERLTLRAPRGGGICYEVTDRLEVSLENPPLDRVYDTEGPPQVVIIVCSGTRLGPGNWTHRTLWFASPV